MLLYHLILWHLLLFCFELLNIEVVDNGEVKRLSDYLDTESFPWWSYIIGAPSRIIAGVQSLFINERKFSSEKLQDGIIILNKKVKGQIDVLKKNITATIDKKTAITNVSVTLQNPRITAVVADSVIHRLQEHIIDYRTSKAKEDCVYLEKLFEERKQEYYAAQKNMLSMWIHMIIWFFKVYVLSRNVYRMI